MTSTKKEKTLHVIHIEGYSLGCFTIPLPPITKKNHIQIVRNKRTNKPMVIQSEAYRQYEHDAGYFVKRLNINKPINIVALFYMPTKRVVDLVNLEEALLDVLVKYGAIADDNSQIVVSMDGSRVLYDKEHPRTEVYFVEFENN